MRISCPHCKKMNNLNLKRKVKCGSCKKEILDYKEGKFNLTGTVLTTTLLVAAGSGYIFNEYIEDQRYPLEFEYTLIELCSTSDKISLSKEKFKEKRKLCICALEKTENTIIYEGINENLKNFIAVLKSNIRICGGLTSANL